jgi:hypothetical protein
MADKMICCWECLKWKCLYKMLVSAGKWRNFCRECYEKEVVK